MKVHLKLCIKIFALCIVANVAAAQNTEYARGFNAGISTCPGGGGGGTGGGSQSILDFLQANVANIDGTNSLAIPVSELNGKLFVAGPASIVENSRNMTFSDFNGRYSWAFESDSNSVNESLSIMLIPSNSLASVGNPLNLQMLNEQGIQAFEANPNTLLELFGDVSVIEPFEAMGFPSKFVDQ